MPLTPEQLFVVLGLVGKYGPQVIGVVKELLSKKDTTIEDVERVFSGLKPYAAFNIPATVG